MPGAYGFGYYGQDPYAGKAASSGTNHLVSLTAAISSAGRLARFVGLVFGATLSPAGVLSRVTTLALVASLSYSGQLNRRTAASFAGSISLAGTFTKLTAVVLAATLNPAGALVRSTRKALSATISPAGNLVEGISGRFYETFTASMTAHGSLTRATAKGLAAAALVPAGAIGRRLSRFLQGVVSFVGGLISTNRGAPTPAQVSSTIAALTVVETVVAPATVVGTLIAPLTLVDTTVNQLATVTTAIAALTSVTSQISGGPVSAPSSLTAGQVLVDTGTFVQGSTNVDPGSVTLKYAIAPPGQPAGTTQTLTYTNASVPAVGIIARTGLGVYVAWLDTTALPGTWTLEWETTGAGQTVSDPPDVVNVEPAVL